MSLKHALLGFINYGPMTGYELKKFFDTSVAHFWNAELSQIYPSLKAMESEGLVEMKIEVQDDRPNRKVYSITDSGKRELLDWLAKPADREQPREPILIKVFFGSSLSKRELIAVLRDCADETRAMLSYLEYAHQFVDKFVESLGLRQEGLFWQLTIGCGLRVHRAELEWAQDAIARIEAADDACFENEQHGYDGDIDIRTATEVLDRVKSLMPGALAGPDAYFHPSGDNSNEQVPGQPRAKVAASDRNLARR